MKLLIMQPSLASRHFIPLRPKYSSQQPFVAAIICNLYFLKLTNQ